jgi:hypothetical protein
MADPAVPAVPGVRVPGAAPLFSLMALSRLKPDVSLGGSSAEMRVSGAPKSPGTR